MKRIQLFAAVLLACVQPAHAESYNNASFYFDPLSTLWHMRGTDWSYLSDPGPGYATIEADYRGYQQLYGFGPSSQGDPTTTPYDNSAIWGYASAFANYGIFKAHAVTNFDATGGPQGVVTLASARSRDTYTIDDPLLNGTTGTLQVALFLSGGARGHNTGSDSAVTDPLASGSLSVSLVNSQGHLIGDPIAQASSGSIAVGGGATSIVAAEQGMLNFTYGTPFTLDTFLSAGAQADPKKEGPNGFDVSADVAQSVETHLGATGYLGFILPQDALLSSESGYSYYQANDFGTLSALIPPPTNPVPVPAAVWLLSSGLLSLLAMNRQRRRLLV